LYPAAFRSGTQVLFRNSDRHARHGPVTMA
jgi:hypothetical protein